MFFFISQKLLRIYSHSRQVRVPNLTPLSRLPILSAASIRRTQSRIPFRASTMAAPQKKYGVALHAGTCDIWNHDAKYQQEVEEILGEIAERAGAKLRSGETAIDVVQAVVVSLENCPLFNAGKGAILNEDGEHELEAAIASTTGGYGAVAAVRNIRNPVEAARAVMDGGRHSLVVGSAADDLARKSGIDMVPNEHFTTAKKKSHWHHFRSLKSVEPSEDLETVGAVALDIRGNLAAASSTGGLTFKTKGRVGDTAIIGAGLAVDENIAVVCSGVGEDILRHSVAGKVAASIGTMALGDSMAKVILKKAEQAPSACATLAIDSTGKVAVESSGRVFPMAYCTSSSASPTSSIMSTTIPLLSQHIIHSDTAITSGLTRYPTISGHTVVVCRGTDQLMSLHPKDFTRVMTTVRELSTTLLTGMSVYHCGLACDGSGTISLLPLHGLDAEWKAVISFEEAYDATFKGYLTSKNGPKMTEELLEETRSRIATATGITEPFNTHFDGHSANQNIFARIIRGEIQQWRIWEDKSHVAFLTPYGNTPGFTVLVPRKHLGSDIFQLEDKDFSELVDAAYKVAQYLKQAFGVKRCGLFFEGFEVDYAHIKLVPVHDRLTPDGKLFRPVPEPQSFQETYAGFLSTQFGPLAPDLGSIGNVAKRLSDLHVQLHRGKAPKSWEYPSTHYQQVLRSPWYGSVFALQDTLFHSTVAFFKDSMNYRYALVPITTDSISSPMGLGSDSLPVEVTLLGQKTYLADSMQFALEYVLRVEEELEGAYYISSSFRGEDPDHMHLNQFYHAECELLGALDEGINIAERYIMTVSQVFLNNHADTITGIAGTTSHMEDLFSLAKKHNGHFPRVTLSDALSFPEIANNDRAWEYVVAADHTKGRAITRFGERVLIERFGGAVWLTEMDHLSAPFYQAFVPGSQNARALCADLLIGPGEVLGLGQRHVSASEVSEALGMHEIPKDKYEWYLNIRDEAKGGKPLQTTGWGMGMERYLAWILKHDDIRDMAIIPRMK